MGAGFGRNLLHPQSKTVPEDGDHRFFLNADTYLQTTWQHIPEDSNLYRTNLTCGKVCNTITQVHLTFSLHILEAQVPQFKTKQHDISFQPPPPPPTNLFYPTKKIAPFRCHWPAPRSCYHSPYNSTAFPKLCTAFPVQLTPTPQRQQVSSAMLVPMYQLHITTTDCNLLLECAVFKNVWDNEKHTQIKFCTVCKEGSTNRNQWHADRQMQL